MQTTSQILMIRPVAFDFNAETAVNNAFQQQSSETAVNEKAQKEFDDFVAVLRANKINVTVIDDTLEPHTPDSIFPNNWASYHDDGTVVLYPMFATNRRLERQKKVLEKINERFIINSEIDLTGYENDNLFLEGTGSVILDREHHIAYACVSPRTSATVLYDFCDKKGYTAVLFTALDINGKQIYHTNVMMCLANLYVIICLDSVSNEAERNILKEKFQETGKEIIQISFEQMNQFAGNMLQVKNEGDENFLVMSTQAYRSLTNEQIKRIETYNPIIHSPLYTIEQNGGGSARCMMAEIFLQKKR